jgi:hypothetical protein
MVALIVLLIVGYFIFNSFGGDGAQDVLQEAAVQPSGQQQGSLPTGAGAAGGAALLQSLFAQMPTPEAPQIVSRPTPAAVQSGAAGSASNAAAEGSATAGGNTWTIMLYQDADDQVLEQDIFVDMNEAERIGSTDNVKVVAQLDRYRGGYSGDGNWTSAKRYLITQDDDLDRIGSQEVQDLGEVNMADPATLVDFVEWAMRTYPADKYALILSDHGMGWPGGWSDPTARQVAVRNFPLSSSLGDMLYLQEIDAALSTIRRDTGLEKFELVGMDACLMGHIEVFSMLTPHARYAVASQETEPALGWAYTGFLGDLNANPSMTGGGLAQSIVATYIDEDQRIVDEEARSALAGGGRPMGSVFGGAPSAESLTRQFSQGITLTAADLAGEPEAIQRLNEFVYVIQQVDPRALAQARSYAQGFTSIFGKQVPPSYIDLGHFTALVAKALGDDTVTQSARNLLESLQKLVITEKSGPAKPGASGVSIYFPTSDLYASPQAGPRSYNVAAQRFVEQSLWDEFLAFFYTGESFEANSTRSTVPAEGIAVRAPAAGGITLSEITLSSETASPDNPVLMTADVAGENIGYIKLLVGYLDPAANSIQVIDSDYLESADTRELGGVYYPVWPEGEFALEFEWEPYVTAVTDGKTDAVALFDPVNYGESAGKAIYGVDGVYTYADGTQRTARALFRAGVLQQVFAYSGEEMTGSPREVLPEPGDTFTVYENWMDLDDSGNVVSRDLELGSTVTFSGQTLGWTELNAAAGQYVVGFIVEDLDGNEVARYAPVTVQ